VVQHEALVRLTRQTGGREAGLAGCFEEERPRGGGAGQCGCSRGGRLSGRVRWCVAGAAGVRCAGSVGDGRRRPRSLQALVNVALSRSRALETDLRLLASYPAFDLCGPCSLGPLSCIAPPLIPAVARAIVPRRENNNVSIPGIASRSRVPASRLSAQLTTLLQSQAYTFTRLTVTWASKP
jgi:hypothetical protein